MTWLIMILFALTFIPACGGGGGGGGGGGTTRTTAITFNEFNDGDLATYTMETWTFNITEDTFISVDLYGSRYDQDSWTATTVNAPVVKIINLSTVIGSPVSSHNLNATTWNFGLRDTEIPLYLLKKTSSTATQSFAIEVTRQSPAASGGLYKLRLNNLNGNIASQFGNHTTETELRGQDTNSIIANAEDIVRPGTFRDALVVGHYEDGNPDFYQLHVDTSITPKIACFEIFAQRNGIWESQIDYYDPEMTFYSPLDAPLNTVDDGFFLDSKICQKASAVLTTTDKYKVEVTKSFVSSNTASADYILKYTEEAVSGVDDETESNDIFSNADPITNFGYLVNGSLSGADPRDWFSFFANAGDMISIRQFDFENSVDASGKVRIEPFDTDGTTPLPFNGPAPLPPVSFGDGRLASLFADLTTTLFIPADGTYYLRVSDDNSVTTTQDYSFIVNRSKQSSAESEPNDSTDGSDADLLTTNASGFGEITTVGDVDYFKLNPADISLSPGDHIAVHVYASRDTDEKAFDTTGYGSALEPKITAYDNGLSSAITSSTYISDSTSDAVAEGINEPFSTITAVFKETGSTFYYFKVEGVNTTTGQYLIEVINLGK